MIQKTRKTLCYKLFNKPGNLEEAIDKAKRTGWAEIKIWSWPIEVLDHHYGKIRSGITSYHFVPRFQSGPRDEHYPRNLAMAQEIAEKLRSAGVERVTLIDGYKKRPN